MIFSFADISINGNNTESNLRWSPVFNFQTLGNVDFSKHTGVFYGVGIRNVGFIYDVPNTNRMMKHRTYNVGIPVGFKIGRLAKTFLYAGYEFEIPFHYKEKSFIDNDKVSKVSGWFSKRYSTVMHATFVGINFPRGFNVKFKYYHTNFFNKHYTETDVAGNLVKPFALFNANVFYIAIDRNVFKDVKKYKRRFKSKPPVDRVAKVNMPYISL